MPEAQISEAVAVFDEPEKIDNAIRALEGSDFPRQDISVLANREKILERFGAEAVNPEWLEDSEFAPRNVPIRPEEKVIGASFLIGVPAYIVGCAAALSVNPAPTSTLLAAITGGSVVGALIGGALVYVIGKKMQARIRKQIDKGGLLLWVTTPTKDKEDKALEILKKNKGIHAHIKRAA